MAEHNQLYQHYCHQPLVSLLDIACGPAYHSRLLAQRGVRTTGLDLHPEMLELAQEKAAAQGVKMTWLVADMRGFQLDGPVEMAICMFDGMDTLTTDEDLACHFCSVGQNLKPGGLYLVDITHPRDVNYQHYSDNSIPMLVVFQKQEG